MAEARVARVGRPCASRTLCTISGAGGSYQPVGLTSAGSSAMQTCTKVLDYLQKIPYKGTVLGGCTGISQVGNSELRIEERTAV